MIDLPMKAEVFCSDGPAGHFTHLVGKQSNHEITHLVVKSYLPPFCEYLVPVDQVGETTNNRIRLMCTRDEMNKFVPFEYEEFIATEVPGYLRGLDPPDVPAIPGYTTDPLYTEIPVKRKNISPEEGALRSSARVKATDGFVGHIDELLVDSNNMQVTHLVVIGRRILQTREMIIPISQVDHVSEDMIYLKLDRKSVEELPQHPPSAGSIP
jgi:hypothetical protein